MAYPPNPFLERRSDRTTSDLDFVGLFSPKLLERVPESVFGPGVHLFHSPPGAGKTTLLRAFTPGALRGFWNSRQADEMRETLDFLTARNIVDDAGPRCLGVMLSCAAGYTDLPAGTAAASNGVFRALFDCRTVIRALRGIAQFIGHDPERALSDISVGYEGAALELKSIPLGQSATQLLAWAERTERLLYARLDSLERIEESQLPTHVRFEGVLWLEGVRFYRQGREIAPARMLMVDDLHRLHAAQLQFLVDELTVLRPKIPLWLAERSVSFRPKLVSQGGRDGRDLSVVALDHLWTNERGHQQFGAFAAFVESVLDRRMAQQVAVRARTFRSLLASDLNDEDIRDALRSGVQKFHTVSAALREEPQYVEWLARADALATNATFEAVRELYKTRIFIARHQRRKQLTLALTPLASEELEEADSGKEDRAAEIFMHDELKIAYYFGFDKIAMLATLNVEEMLQLAAALYEGVRTKQIMRQRVLMLMPTEQERIIEDVARRRLHSVPTTHTQGTRATRMLLAIGQYCRERTFLPNAPYAPGVTGIYLPERELSQLESENSDYGETGAIVAQVLSECVAENLLAKKTSQATTGREAGLVFYLNRILCAYFGLPLQHGGWQEVGVADIAEWINRGPAPVRRQMRVFE